MTEVFISPKADPGKPPAAMPPLSSAELSSAYQKQVEVHGSPEAFKNAAARDGINIHEVSAEQAKDQRERSLAGPSTSLDEYKISLANAASIKPENYASTITELRTFARDMKLSPGIGAAVVERVSALGPAYAKMTPDQQQQWVSDRQNELARMGIDAAKLAAMQKDAAEVLEAHGNVFGKNLAKSPVLKNDLWLLRTLSQHKQSLDAHKQRFG